MGFQCGVIGGAPVVAASTGAYVAGTAVVELSNTMPETPVQSEPAKPTAVAPLDPQKIGCTTDTQVRKPMEKLNSGDVESQWRLDRARSESGDTGTAPTEKDCEEHAEIPLGYSPSSRKTTTSDSSHGSKYDKYYHQ